MGLLWTTQEHHHHTRTETTIEKRAPTDESVRLLREMEQEASDRVTVLLRVQNNVLQGLVAERCLSPEKAGYELIFRFKLNGRDYAEKLFVDSVEARESIDLKQKLVRYLADAVAEEMLRAVRRG